MCHVHGWLSQIPGLRRMSFVLNSRTLPSHSPHLKWRRSHISSQISYGDVQDVLVAIYPNEVHKTTCNIFQQHICTVQVDVTAPIRLKSSPSWMRSSVKDLFDVRRFHPLVHRFPKYLSTSTDRRSSPRGLHSGNSNVHRLHWAAIKENVYKSASFSDDDSELLSWEFHLVKHYLMIVPRTRYVSIF